MNITNKYNGLPLVGFGHLEQSGVEMEFDVQEIVTVDRMLYEERLDRERAIYYRDPFKDGDISNGTIPP